LHLVGILFPRTLYLYFIVDIIIIIILYLVYMELEVEKKRALLFMHVSITAFYCYIKKKVSKPSTG